MADWFKRGAFSIRARKAVDPQTEFADLERRAEELRTGSKCSRQDWDAFAVECAKAIAEKHGLDLPTSILVRLAETIDAFAVEAGARLPEIDTEALDINSETGRWARDYLRMQVSFLEHEDASLDTFFEVMEAALGHVLARLALNPACKAALTASPINDEGLSLRLIDYVRDVPEMIEGVTMCFHTGSVRNRPMFKLIRSDIEASAALASGLNPSRVHASEQYITPTRSDWSDPGELATRYLGRTPIAELLNAELPVTLPDTARFEHTHILGGTGHGKTQLMSQLILRDIARMKDEKRSIIVMDSQGDLISKLLSLAELQGGSLADKLVVIDPTEFERPIALNPFTLSEDRMATYSAADRERVVHSAVSLFEYFFSDLLGADLTAHQGTMFKFLIRLLVEIPDATLLTLRDLMDHPERFRPHIEKLSGAARVYFEREFLTGGYASTRKQISKRLWGVLSNPVFERLFSSPVNRLDWFDLMQSGHIILINTAKDFLKEDGARLLGRFLTAQIGQGILERAAIPEHARTPTFFYIDEAQDQVDATVEMLLTQARKYKLGLTMAHQYMDQLSPSQRSNMLANTSIKLAGGLNRKDAQAMAAEMRCTPDFLQSMHKQERKTQFAFSIRHMIDSAVPLTVPLGLIDQQDTVAPEVVAQRLEINRQRYGRLWEPEGFEKREVQPVAVVDPIVPESEEAPSPPAQKDLPRRGSAAHKAEQERIRVLGAELGYLAKVEASLRDGLGAVDISLANDKTRIGVEVSITTPPEHEVGNILKCLSAGFDYVIATAPDRDRLKAIERSAWSEVSAADSPKVLFLMPEDIEGFLRSQRDEPDESKIMGYTVISKIVPTSSEAKRRKRERLAWLLEQQTGA